MRAPSAEAAATRAPTVSGRWGVRLHADAARLGEAVASEVAAAISRTRPAGSPCLIGVPAGRTMASTFTALAALVHDRPRPLDHVVIVMMDDYLEPDGTSWRLVDESLAHSCRRFGTREVLAPLNAAVDGVAEGIRSDALWSPDPSDPAAYDEAIAAHGGMELFLVAVGAGDGHVAFNPPGTPLDSLTRVLEIADTTRADNTATFPHLGATDGGFDAVPTYGVSVGLGTIAASRRLVAAIHGADKREALARLVCGDGFDPAFPASFLRTRPGTQLHVDDAAAGTLAADLAAADSPSAPDAEEPPR